MRQDNPSHTLRTLLILTLVSGPGAVLANPEGGTVVSGQAAIVRESATRTTIQQHSNTAIIDWNSFSIGAGETTHFNQPSASSLAVNRVTGNDPSAIFGNLTATGRLMLINRNGILFGQGSRVDVSGLIATTIDIPNQRILDGDFRFDQGGNPAASVINRGTITVRNGGLAALVAPGVENSGVIQARLGRIQLASSNAFTVDLYGDGLIKLPVDGKASGHVLRPDGTPLSAAVRNSGTIEADGGTVVMSANTAKGLLDRVVNMDGIIQARSVAQVNGEIVLSGGEEGIVAVSGTLDASGTDAGETGGTVKVLGEKVGLFDEASIDASGDEGGGEILIGGNFQGKGPEQNAVATFVGEDARIDASAKTDGAGGRVIVWADDVTNFYGDVDVSAGAQSGDGGFVEVSGKDYLDFQGTVDRTATNGDVGTLLLDPRNLTIRNAGPNSNLNGVVNPFVSTGNSAILTTATLVAALNAGNVTVSTGGTGGEAGNLTISNAINAPANASNLTLNAHRNILVDAAINMAAGTGSLTLNADSDNNDSGNINLRTNAGDITTNGQPISFTGANFFSAAGATVDSNGGDITIAHSVVGNTMNFSSVLTPGAFEISDATLDNISADGGNIIIGGPTQTGNIITSQALTYAGTADTLILQTAGTVTISNSFDPVNSDLTFIAENITLNAAVPANGRTVTIQPRTGADTVVLGTNPGTANSVELDDTELDRITATTLVIGSAAGGAITVTADISPNNTNTLHLLSGSTVTGAAGGIAENNLAITAGDTISITDVTTDVNNLAISAAGQTVTFVDTDDLDIDTVNAINGITATTVNLTTGGALTDAQAIVATNLSITNAAAATTLDVAANDVDNLAVSAAGQTVTFVDTDDLDIDTVNAINGITATTVNLTTGGALTDAQAIVATNLSVTNVAAATTLDAAANDVDNLAVSAAGQTVTFVDTDDLDIDTVNAINGITATTVNLTTGGALTDAQAIVATNLSITNAAAATTLDAAANDVDNLAVSAAGQTVTFVDTDDLDIDTVNAINGITATTVNLTTGGALTDAQAIVATNLSVTNAAAATTLDAAANDVDTLAVSAAGQTVNFTDTDGLDLGSVNGINGVAATTFNLNTGGAITGSQASTITGATTIAAGAGNDITLNAAANNFASVGITTGNNVTLTDTNAITLNASTISGTLGINANSGVTVASNVTSNGTTTIDADLDNNGTGTLTVAAGAALSSSGNQMNIIAADLIVDTATGSITSGAGDMTIDRSMAGTIRLGSVASDMTITDAELDRIFANNLTVGGTTAVGILINDITNTSITGTLTATANGNANADIGISGTSSFRNPNRQCQRFHQSAR